MLDPLTKEWVQTDEEVESRLNMSREEFTKIKEETLLKDKNIILSVEDHL